MAKLFILVLAGNFLRIMENTVSVSLQTQVTLIFWFWVEIYEGDPLVSNKHSLSDTGSKTVLLKRPEITFMKINFISTWTISIECSGHRHFFLLSQQGFFMLTDSESMRVDRGIITILTKTQPWVKYSTQRPKLAQILRSQKPGWSNLVAVLNQQRCQFPTECS